MTERPSMRVHDLKDEVVLDGFVSKTGAQSATRTSRPPKPVIYGSSHIKSLIFDIFKIKSPLFKYRHHCKNSDSDVFYVNRYAVSFKLIKFNTIQVLNAWYSK